MTKNKSIRSDTDLRKQILPQPEEFEFLPRGSEETHFTINGNNGKVKLLSEVTNPKAEHFIRVRKHADRDKVKRLFENAVYEFESSVNGGVAWIGKQEIIEAFSRLKHFYYDF